MSSTLKPIGVIRFINGVVESAEPDKRVEERVFLNGVLEGSGNNAHQGILMQKLYKDIMINSNIDFGKIPNSKGDLTKCAYYENIKACMDIIDELFTEDKPKELLTAKELEKCIINFTRDFVFGFNIDDKMCILIYNLMVATLMDLINICVVKYVRYMKITKSIQMNKMPDDTKFDIINGTAQSFIDSCKNGSWASYCTDMRKNKKGFLGATLATGGILAAVTPIGWIAGIILGLVALLGAIRLAIYFYYSSADKVSNASKYNSQLAKNYLELNNLDASDNSQKLMDTLDDISDKIETNIIKSNKVALDKQKQTDKDYRKDSFEITNSNPVNDTSDKPIPSNGSISFL